MKSFLEFEDDPNSSAYKALNDWMKLIQAESPPVKTGFDELPKDHPDYDTVRQIREQLLARGIDPSTVYPVDCDFDTRQTIDEPVTMTLTFAYKNGDDSG